LSQTRCDAKPFRGTVNSGSISQMSRKVLPLPEQVDVVLNHVPAQNKEVSDCLCFVCVEPGKKDSRSATHGRLPKLSVGFEHKL